MQDLTPFPDPETWLRRHQPDAPVMFFAPRILRDTARRFQSGFPGLVTYAVKANPRDEVLENLCSAGLGAFDVASPAEMAAVRAVCPDAVLHYNNPVRSPAEVAVAWDMGVASCSVDSLEEMDKLTGIAGREISVRLALPVPGAAYDFGEKFGACPELAETLLRRVAELGARPAMTFHPGTQCADPAAWARYIGACAGIAARAGVRLERLNVGGGFAAHRNGAPPDLEAIFARIATETARAFGQDAPALVCEPGRAMVAEAYTLATRIKARRGPGRMVLNDGVYGALAEWRDIGPGDRVRVIAPDGAARNGRVQPVVAFGPTCDSLDRLPDPLALPADTEEGDFVLFSGMGAYSLALATRFNGYGPSQVVTVA
ncbi:type III PLP-dependent enzyme [Lutimaribacter sp. EGI FJ00015]|uniref:Type III PLP-dependent enzyme n=1 Tax=Lutimaribacter degradans TaxID=2945989 RepID=A0ACC5ZRI2_9RHOB|nr:type III PLP-dependent enzyme [Lutimaribacter sp. EGI FJ00013]MCM2560697.1 type III PLP-dependent enzyme [Lutimaribacter sp. EGI FJ00013]MCO0612359.1 type III PLP-dependent enzyme [Lutimaribacter sp. EGI FJ00015]MCO0634521.1 type III PLP-dependent enzyme [Lutimaribacter sp. EGI FJ00014]